MRSLYIILNAPGYPATRTGLKAHIEPHLQRVVEHYSRTFTLDGEEFAVLEDAQAALDTFSPGASGAAGLAGVLWQTFRSATRTQVVHVRQGNIPEHLADNPYYLPEVDEDEEGPTTEEKQVRISVGEICTRILQNPTLAKQYKEWVPVLELYLCLTISSAECERAVSVLKLIKNAKRNRMGQDLLEQLMSLKLNGPTLAIMGANQEDELGDEIPTSSGIDKALKVFFSDKKRMAAVPESWKRDYRSTYVWGNVWSEDSRQTPVAGTAHGASAVNRTLTGLAPIDASSKNKEKDKGKRAPATDEEKAQVKEAKEQRAKAMQAGRKAAARKRSELTPEQLERQKEETRRKRLGLEEVAQGLDAGRSERRWMHAERQLPSTVRGVIKLNYL